MKMILAGIGTLLVAITVGTFVLAEQAMKPTITIQRIDEEIVKAMRTINEGVPAPQPTHLPPPIDSCLVDTALLFDPSACTGQVAIDCVNDDCHVTLYYSLDDVGHEDRGLRVTCEQMCNDEDVLSFAWGSMPGIAGIVYDGIFVGAEAHQCGD